MAIRLIAGALALAASRAAQRGAGRARRAAAARRGGGGGIEDPAGGAAGRLRRSRPGQPPPGRARAGRGAGAGDRRGRRAAAGRARHARHPDRDADAARGDPRARRAARARRADRRRHPHPLGPGRLRSVCDQRGDPDGVVRPGGAAGADGGRRLRPRVRHARAGARRRGRRDRLEPHARREPPPPGRAHRSEHPGAARRRRQRRPRSRRSSRWPRIPPCCGPTTRGSRPIIPARPARSSRRSAAASPCSWPGRSATRRPGSRACERTGRSRRLPEQRNARELGERLGTLVVEAAELRLARSERAGRIRRDAATRCRRSTCAGPAPAGSSRRSSIWRRATRSPASRVLAAARLGGLRLLASPYELGVEVAARIRSRVSGPLMLVAHANDWLGYLLEPDRFRGRRLRELPGLPRRPGCAAVRRRGRADPGEPRAQRSALISSSSRRPVSGSASSTNAGQQRREHHPADHARDARSRAWCPHRPGTARPSAPRLPRAGASPPRCRGRRSGTARLRGRAQIVLPPVSVKMIGTQATRQQPAGPLVEDQREQREAGEEREAGAAAPAAVGEPSGDRDSRRSRPGPTRSPSRV